MLTYVLRRLLVMIPIFIGSTIISFIIVNSAPGDVADLMTNPSLPIEEAERQRAALGLDRPLPERYVRWVSELAQGNLGYSPVTFRPVKALVGERVVPTLILMGSGLVLAYVIAVPLGTMAAVRSHSWLDYLSSVVSLMGVSIPSFFLALALIYVFAVRLRWFPMGGYLDVGESGMFAVLKHLMMPAFVMATSYMGSVTRYVRSSVLEVLRADYVRTAMAKGLGPLAVRTRHVLRNALLPIVTLLGLQLPALVGGAVVLEQVFQWPGLGHLMVQSVQLRDYATLMALNLLTTMLVLAGSLLTDVLYAILDPRIRYS